MSRICILAGILLAAVAMPAIAAANEPVPFRAVYKARYYGFPIGATGIRELKKEADGRYLLTSRAHNFLGTIDERTTFTLDGNNRVVPEQYQYRRTGIGRNRTTLLKFDWSNRQITEGDDATPWKIALKPGTQDNLSYQFMLRSDLTDAWRRGEEWPTLKYTIADDGQLKEYSFRVVGEETVKTAIGEFKTVKATRTGGNPKRITNFWLAPAYNFLLIRFEQIEPNGGGFELMLRRAKFDGKDIKGGK